MSASDGSVVGTAKIVDHGPDSARWNLVIIGDGYQASELTQYHTDVQSCLMTLRTTPPFDELFFGINVHRIDVVSTDSGADDPIDPIDCAGGTGATPRTFFDATFCSVGPGGRRLDRLLTIDTALAKSVASAQVPLRHQVLCIVNSSKYGGSGGDVPTFSTESQASEIGIHELGHSAFGLADEYGGDGTGTPAGEPMQPNVTRDTNRATNKWRDLIAAMTPMPSKCAPNCATSTCVPPASPPAAGEVGTYEGAIYSNCNTYRPLLDCYMRTLRQPFCPVCTRVIRQTLQPFLPADVADIFVSLNSASAEVRVEPVSPRISRIPAKPPEVSASCNSVRTWTFSGRHQTHNNGEVTINLNKFLECVSASIEGVIHSNYIGSLPHFTATPESEEPAFLTCTIDAKKIAPPPGQVFLPQALDITIKVVGWKHDGNPAPDVAFNWIAVAVVATATNV
jgi:hypothetical protein